MTKPRRLGRGLEALLGQSADAYHENYRVVTDDATDDVVDAAVAAEDEGEGPRLIALNVFDVDPNPFQPRLEFDEADLESLASSIREHGMIQPVVVRRAGERYQLVSGERRLRAAIKAGWAEVPAQVREVDDRQAAELAIVENLQRRDLNPLEKAASFQQYLQRYGCTQEELAGRLQLDRSTVANLIRLLELPEVVQDALRRGGISQGHARALLPLGDERTQVEFCRRIEQDNLSVRAVEGLVQQTIRSEDAEPLSVISQHQDKQKKSADARSKHAASMEQELRAALGTKIDLKQSTRGRGKIVIHFASHEEFERLRRHLLGNVPQQQAG